LAWTRSKQKREKKRRGIGRGNSGAIHTDFRYHIRKIQGGLAEKKKAGQLLVQNRSRAPGSNAKSEWEIGVVD